MDALQQPTVAPTRSQINTNDTQKIQTQKYNKGEGDETNTRRLDRSTPQQNRTAMRFTPSVKPAQTSGFSFWSLLTCLAGSDAKGIHSMKLNPVRPLQKKNKEKNRDKFSRKTPTTRNLGVQFHPRRRVFLSGDVLHPVRIRVSPPNRRKTKKTHNGDGTFAYTKTDSTQPARLSHRCCGVWFLCP